MPRIHIPASGLEPWQAGLADPIKHWVDGKSAKELARSWVAAESTPRGLPTRVAELVDQNPALLGASLLLGIPEHAVDLPSPGRPSMNDFWGILRRPNGLISMAVEGKSGEPFGELLCDWLKDASPGKHQRLKGLCEILGVDAPPPPSLRYQLFHRTASPILEAQRWGIGTAVMIVHTFGGTRDQESRKDYEAFCDWLGAAEGSMRHKRLASGMDLYLGWIDDTPATAADVVTTITSPM